MNWIKALVGAPFEIAGKAYESYLSRRIREAELEDAKHARRIEVVKQGKINEATWNQRAIENSGWRDEWVTILLSIPLILVFGPDDVQAQIKDGFAVLQELPDWYKAGVGLMIASAFGYQKFAHNRMTKAYSLPTNTEGDDE